MARKARIWFPGATYHIMCRGNHKNPIFRDNSDRFEFLHIMRETQKQYPYLLHSYCLMTNHVHLQIETQDINIGQIMKKINMSYAIYFNSRYQVVGHLFQDRYRAELIDTDAYNLEINRYIHQNPVRAKIVDQSIDFEWSSYREYMGIRNDDMVTISTVLGYFQSCGHQQSQRLYREYVERS